MSRSRTRFLRRVIAPGAVFAVTLAVSAAPAAAQQAAWTWDPADPRIGLTAGFLDAGVAARHMALAGRLPRADGFFNPGVLGDGGFSNTDLAFQGNYVFVGNYHGIQVFDISDPVTPRFHLGIVCPGGQGDVSVYRHLLFMSAQEVRGRKDCGTEGVEEVVSPERFRGVRIFDISDLNYPRQVAAVQSCRGSHTHTLVTDPRDDEHVYVYIQGTSPVRPGEEMPGCSAGDPAEDPETALFRIEVVQVPLAAPQNARIINAPRIFADRETGAIAGLWAGGTHGPGTQATRSTDRCHDITAYPAIGLAAGACSGNGILLDISDPANPVRIDEVIDPNFAYWHSATFNNDGTSIIFTDEWGGGVAPRCRASDSPAWGANALFRLRERTMELAGYYKLPVPQTETENCVAHNGSLVPVPGRDIKVQAWYQGGISVFDFTDPARPFEIAFFDRGPLSDTTLYTGGYWSAYWHNGHIYGTDIERGIDVFTLLPSEHLSVNELEAASLVRLGEFNAQMQPRITWPAAFAVPRAYLDQLERNSGLAAARIAEMRAALDRAERAAPGASRTAALNALDALSRQLDATAGSAGDPGRVRALAAAARDLSASLR
jgi:hypothetical protein